MADPAAATPAVTTPAGATQPVVRRVRNRTEPRHGTVVLVHGTMDTSASFRRVVDYLPHWSVVSYDRRGWERRARCSGRPRSPTTSTTSWASSPAPTSRR